MRCCKRYGNKVLTPPLLEQQEQEISRSLRQQGELVGQRLQLRQQQQQLSQQIVAAADEIARLAQGQANNAATRRSDPGRDLRFDRTTSASGPQKVHSIG